jgi:hypothetical protein
MSGRENRAIIYGDESTSDAYRIAAEQAAERNGWAFRTIMGSPDLAYGELTGNIGALVVVSNDVLPKRKFTSPFAEKKPTFSLANMMVLASQHLPELPTALVTDQPNPKFKTIHPEIIVPDSGRSLEELEKSIGAWLDNLVEAAPVYDLDKYRGAA